MISRHSPCPNCKGRAQAIGYAFDAEQRPVYPHFCLHCSTVLPSRATKREADAYAKSHGSLARVVIP